MNDNMNDNIPLFKKGGRKICEVFVRYGCGQNAVLIGEGAHRPTEKKEQRK